MTPKIENEIAIRNKVILGLEKEIKIQDELIREQKIMIKILEDQNSQLPTAISSQFATSSLKFLKNLRRNSIRILLLFDITDYQTDVYYNANTGERIHVAFPSGGDDMNYDGSIKCRAF